MEDAIAKIMADADWRAAAAKAQCLTVAGSSSFTNQGSDGTTTLGNGSNALTGPVSLNTIGPATTDLFNAVSTGTTLAASNVGGTLELSNNFGN